MSKPNVGKSTPNKPATIGERLAAKGADKVLQRRRENLWKGPLVDGITYSMLSKFLVCRERFRLATVEGLAVPNEWNHRTGYGDMWHVCEEVYAGGGDWEHALSEHVTELCRLNPLNQEDIAKWFTVCRVQFPLYIDHWAKHPHTTSRQPIFEEEVFRVPYQLPASGRVVKLRGKWDSIDLVKSGEDRGIWIQDNKTKGDIYEPGIRQQMHLDMQSMFYCTAFTTLQQYAKDGTELDTEDVQPEPEHWGNVAGIEQRLRGIRYNVVRRPLSGGRHSIKPHQPTKKNPEGESQTEYYNRLHECIKSDADYFFLRVQATLEGRDIPNFRRMVLDPVLEQVCDWWEWVSECHHTGKDPFTNSRVHWLHPYGLFNPVDNGYTNDIDMFLRDGNLGRLKRREKLFTELEP